MLNQLVIVVKTVLVLMAKALKVIGDDNVL
jgi:hypothetical protein